MVTLKCFASNSALSDMRNVFNMCLRVLLMEFYVGGYKISLYALLIFGIVCVILLWIIFRIFNS